MAHYRDKPEDVADAEAFELQESRDDHDPEYAAGASDPLLPPSYAAAGYPPRATSPLAALKRRRPRAKGRRTFVFLCAALSLLLLSAAGGAYYARQHDIKIGGLSWDALPPSVKEWLDHVVPTLKVSNDDKNFPTNIGYAGPTPTGKEPALLVTAPHLPQYTGVSPLIPPSGKSDFNIHHHWGNLSPYHTVKSHGLPESSQLIPRHCKLDEMHWLQRHGARYPTSNPLGPAGFAKRIGAAKGWKAGGKLAFLNHWDYKLGAELLTPFGRSQLYNLGVAARVKYGFLLERFNGRLPVLRTETQDRMLRSAQNWAAGFFGIPHEDQFNLEVIIEAPGFNCTLSPYHSCPNDDKVYPKTRAKLAEWDKVFLKDARERIQKLIKGYDVSLADVNNMMEMCAYETVALGHSAFCDLFTDKEWKGFEYRSDIYWWYAASFGSPVARAEGLGWLQELTARLTHTRVTEFNSTTNSSLHDDLHFPVNDPLYVDFTHDTTFAQLLPTLNLTSFSESGPPPLDHIPKHWSFITSKFAPFATNLQVQVLTCGEKVANTESSGSSWWPFNDKDKEKRHGDDDDDDDDEDEEEEHHTATPTSTTKVTAETDASHHDSATSAESQRYVRIILNDAPVPLTGINGCKRNDDGLCSLDSFVSSMHTLIGEVDFYKACHTDYDFEPEVGNGRPLDI